MVLRKNFKIGVMIGIFILLISFVPQVSTANPINVMGTIDDAFYADLDGEGDTFDIQYNVSVSIFNFKGYHRWWGYSLVLYTAIGFPSGYEVWYQIDIIAYVSNFKLIFVFEDAATESGWYIAHLISHSSSLDEDYIIYYTLEFDPPGGGGGGGPPPALKVSVV